MLINSETNASEPATCYYYFRRINAYKTENNLTSDTSNPNFVVSQRSTSGSNPAWKAMDGNLSTYSKTQYTQNVYDWWKIDFKMPVVLKGITLKCDNESSYGVYLEGSNDDSTWTRVDNNKFPDNQQTSREYSFSDGYRYYRLICEVPYYYIQFYEINFLYEPLENVILATDQSINQKFSDPVDFQIEYKIYPEDTIPTFSIIDGTLPDGLSLTEDGRIIGTAADVFTGSITVEISAENFEPVQIVIQIKLSDDSLVVTDGLTFYISGKGTAEEVTEVIPDIGNKITNVVGTVKYQNIQGKNCIVLDPGCYFWDYETANYWNIDGQKRPQILSFSCLANVLDNGNPDSSVSEYHQWSPFFEVGKAKGTFTTQGNRTKLPI